jgi:hypothetical protein
MGQLEADLRDKLTQALRRFVEFRDRREELLRHAYLIPDLGSPGHEPAEATLVLAFVDALNRFSASQDIRIGQMANFLAELRHRAGAIDPLEAGAPA